MPLDSALVPAINLSGAGSAARGAYGGYGVWMASSNPSGTGKNPRPGEGQSTNTDTVDRQGRHYPEHVVGGNVNPGFNTVIDPAYEQKVLDDIAEIQAGGGTQLQGNRIQITRNGETRIYGFDDRTGRGIYHIYPIEGDGFFQMDATSYRILQQFVANGNPIDVLENFGRKSPMFASRSVIEDAIEVWQTIPGNNIDSQTLIETLDEWQTATGRP